MAGATGRESDKFMLRLPDGMRDRIRFVAERNNRSINAEIVATLEKAYPPPVTDQVLKAVYGTQAVLNVLAETGNEALIQEGLKAAEKTLEEVGMSDRRFFYTEIGGQFVVLMEDKNNPISDLSANQLASQVIREMRLAADGTDEEAPEAEQNLRRFEA
jgi:hypothetical protein